MLAMSGCFTALSRHGGRTPPPGEAVEFFLLDVVTSPVQLLWAIGSGLDDLHQWAERRERERKISRTADSYKARIESMSFDPDSYDVWDAVGAKAMERLVSDHSVPFTEEQLAGIDAIYVRQSERISAGKGGWWPRLPDLWTRPEWSPESLAAACGSFMPRPVHPEYYRQEQMMGYVSSAVVPDDCLHEILAAYAGNQFAVMTAPEVFEAARSNLLSRIVRDEAWLESLAARYKVSEWPPASSTNLLAEADARRILAEHERNFYDKADILVFGDTGKAREALARECGEYNTRDALPRFSDTASAIGEICFADPPGEHPSFVAFARCNAIVVIRAGDGRWPPDILDSARFIDSALRRKLQH